MAQERRIFGPPGTGKTELLARTIIPQAVESFGPDRVMVCSLTKTGARTIASRAEGINQNNVGTIHKICYRALGMPKLTNTVINEWNEQYPQFSLSGGSSGASQTLDEGCVESSGGSQEADTVEGEKLMAKLNIFRSKLVPREEWPENIKAFESLWNDFKKQTDTVDFTDLIEKANEEIPRAPGNPVVLIVDEAQDTNPLQLKLLRSWAVMMDHHIFVGDDDQTIFEFAGCTAEAFLNPPLPDEFKRVLSQSYRVPYRVHQLAQYIINRVSFREQKQYFPRRDENGNFIEGIVRKTSGTYKKLDYVVGQIKDKIEEGKTVMFLASCAYMVDPLKSQLIEAGIPFENEFRRRRGDWNPLYDKNGVSSKQIIQSFMSTGEDGDFWTIEQFVTWSKFLTVSDSGLVKKVGKKAIAVLEQAIEDNAEGLHSARNVIKQILGKDAIDPAMNRDLKWLVDNIQKTRINSMQYPLKVMSNYGFEKLSEKPKVTIGTIHSVKGGQADCVIISPDISMRAARGCQYSMAENDSVNRLFYVAVTRAREEVVVLEPATKFFFRF